ncbi:hypothetical protein CHGG_03235 [Chaetomium globosum CBS 148.51]|uniref:Uncharacterized protein n=1 Tax=Chaetomium globosum (strain ATCC 6205 / CBS 148.51 / DSM 1962 / NBRC 6347 / NRRL 1970) TaxID=306901 RepID=Q2H969_CHAGB|nr:uncharacterized protein CHGG_03235 [Chaetomium globosum CBS 148.51]EAQ91300.1 hypothetical protein CHGG_03235 [Chaetomium globosum CBS 148.51]
MAQMSASFGSNHHGLQVGYNYGSIEFPPPGKITVAPCRSPMGCPTNVQISERRETPPIPFATIPFSRDPDFVNRGDILDQIDERCSELAGRVALVGLGGVGKSQLAIEYAHRIAAGHLDRWVFWVHAGTQARVEEGFRKIADDVKLPGRNQPGADIPQLVYGWLSNERNGRWIIILDSADDRNVFYSSDNVCNRKPFADFLPQSRNGSIIITTRNKDLASRLTGRRQNIIEVGPMVQMDALTLLERKLGSILNTDAAAKLISFDHIRSERPSAADLLSLMSFFDRQGIPESLLKSSKQTKTATRASGSEDAEDSGFDSSDDEMDGRFEDDVAILRDYYLIVVNEAGDQFEMHGLVQLSMRKWLETFRKQETFKQQFIEQMAASFPTGEYENWVKCWSLFAHVQVALGYQPSEETVEIWATLLHNGGWYAWSQGRYEVAEQMLGKARNVRKKKLGAENMATLASISLFALVQMDRGQWEEAEKLFVQVMETRKTKLGADHPSTLMSMANLASTYRNQGRWEEAEKLFVQVMETSKTKLGADHPDTLMSMANLASTYRNQGRWEEAEKLDVQVMETRKTKLGADHPDTLTSMNNLASTYRNQGRWEEAEKLFVQVMETSKTKLGADHPDTLTSMNNLAFTWKGQGRHTDALALIEDCAQAQQRILGADHPYTRSSLATVAKWSS